MTVGRLKPRHYRDGNKHPVTFAGRCDRCDRVMVGQFGMDPECLICVQEALKVWPGLGALKGGASGG